MKSSVLHLLFIASTCISMTKQNATTVEPTNTRRTEGHRNTNIYSGIQQIQVQLNSIEGESQRQAAGMQELGRIASRLEAQRQEFISTIDRSESRLSQRLDDIKGDVRKVLTLQEVIRDDVDKVQQNQLLQKVWLEEQLRYHNVDNTPKLPTDFNSILLSTSSDVMLSIQMIQTTMNSLRRMADTLQNSIAVVQSNVTMLVNNSRKILDYQQNALPTRSYLQSSLQSVLSERQEQQLVIGCSREMQNHERAEILPKDCQEVQDKVQNTTGIYRIQPDYAKKPIFAYCDMETETGGWTVIQRRKDGSVDFLRDWNEYKYGFGNVAGEFWMGNENLHLITLQKIYELRIDLKDFEDGQAYTKYAGFAVGSEKEKYMLKLLGPLSAGDAGDGLTYHASIPFSTKDMDNDHWDGGNCAEEHTGGWWYNQCDASNLNGQYLKGLTPEEYKGVYWHEWQGPNYSLRYTTMMIRPIMFTKLKVDVDVADAKSIPDDSISPLYLHL